MRDRQLVEMIAEMRGSDLKCVRQAGEALHLMRRITRVQEATLSATEHTVLLLRERLARKEEVVAMQTRIINGLRARLGLGPLTPPTPDSEREDQDA